MCMLFLIQAAYYSCLTWRDMVCPVSSVSVKKIFITQNLISQFIHCMTYTYVVYRQNTKFAIINTQTTVVFSIGNTTCQAVS